MPVYLENMSIDKIKNILIVGSGKAGRLLKADIHSNFPELRVIGFVNDSVSSKKEKYLGTINDLPKISKIYKVDEIVIAIPSTDGKLIRRILLGSVTNRIPIKIVPRDQRIISSSHVLYSDVKDLDVDDFLGRPFVKKNVDRLINFYQGKTVFVTGGAGSIGSEIVRQLIDLNVKKVVVYDNSEYLIFLLEQQLKERGLLTSCELIVGSILHGNKLNRLLERIRPHIVFHAAAYKHVHLMQDNIDEAIYNNVIGTKCVIDAALAIKVELFTFISTDKVVSPTSIMGATKKLCEYYIQSLRSKNTKFNIVRFGNVINSNGSALPLFERQIALHKYVTITHKKMERFFMSIREAAQLVIESTATGKRNSIHILNMGELINIYEVALCLIRSKNMIPDLDIAVTIIGLRKGEKMIEELYTQSERGNMKSTKIDQVLSVKNQDTCQGDINEILVHLESLVTGSADQKKLLKILVDIFPTIRKL